MRYQTFGRKTGLRVSEYVLGTANFGTSSTAAGEEGSRQIFAAFVAAGGTTFDSSNIYQAGEAETVLGPLLGKDRDDFVIIAKYSGTRLEQPRPGTTGNSRKIMIRSLEQSLRRLGTGYVDVFMPHFPDGTTPVDEILAGFDDLVTSGKILHGGLSNFPAWRTAGAVVRADARGLAPLVGVQTEYSLAERSAEREMLPMAQALGLGVLLYSPLAGGLLTGKYRRGADGRLAARRDAIETPQKAAVVDTVIDVAETIGSTPVHVCLAWLRRRAFMAGTSMIPIIGPRTVAHLESYLQALGVELSDQQYRQLDAVGAPRSAPRTMMSRRRSRTASTVIAAGWTCHSSPSSEPTPRIGAASSKGCRARSLVPTCTASWAKRRGCSLTSRQVTRTGREPLGFSPRADERRRRPSCASTDRFVRARRCFLNTVHTVHATPLRPRLSHLERSDSRTAGLAAFVPGCRCARTPLSQEWSRRLTVHPGVSSSGVLSEQAAWWCPVCLQARTVTFTFASRRDDQGYRRVEAAVCDRGHAFDPYT